MKVGICQIDTKIGDFKGNVSKIKEACNKAKNMGADFAVFPELALCGYSPRDYLAYSAFVDKCQACLEELSTMLPIPAVIGAVRQSPIKGHVYNSAYWVADKKSTLVADKVLLPIYGIFDEARTYMAGERKENFITFKGKKISFTICEDIWSFDFLESSKFYPKPHPLDLIKDADLVVNISASLWTIENYKMRQSVLANVPKKTNAHFVFCNLVGGNDEAVFDGHSCAFDKDAKLICTLDNFKEDIKVVDIFNAKPIEDLPYCKFEDLKNALEMSIRDFVVKSGFKKVLLGLSGGIDSAVVAALAVGALGKENVMGVSLPSKISSEHSKSDAKSLAENLGIEFHTVSIAQPVDAFSDSLKDMFKGTQFSVAEENLQARSRGSILMAISNKFGSMLLTTGNKSECAVGYCTLYGDMCGSFAPIADVYKTDVYALANQININGEIIPQNTIDKAPSAELRPNQKDQDSLPDYDTLDSILKMYIEEKMSPEEIVDKSSYKKELVEDVVKKVLRNEFKRRQAAIAPRVTEVSFGFGRRVPIVYKGSV